MGSSDRAFGLVFAVFFAIVALLPIWNGAPPRLWALGVGVAFLAAALAAPRILAPLNRAWLKLGDLLHRIVNPIALAILYYGVVTPTGLVMRLFGQDPLRLRFDKAAKSYWIARVPPGPSAESLKDQF
jgi:hypothetical protein